MPLCCGGRLIPRAEEKSVRLSTVISPSAIRLRPATASSKVVLPDPDGPKIAVIHESKDASISSSKFASGMRQRRSMSCLLSRAKQPFRRPYEQECQRDRSEERRVGKECRDRWLPYH